MPKFHSQRNWETGKTIFEAAPVRVHVTETEKVMRTVWSCRECSFKTTSEQGARNHEHSMSRAPLVKREQKVEIEEL